MKYLYVKNYLDLTSKEKEDFFIFLKKNSSRYLTRQRVVMSENALILDFSENSNMSEIKTVIEKYFSTYSHITTHIIEEIVKQSDHLILQFEDKRIRVR